MRTNTVYKRVSVFFECKPKELHGKILGLVADLSYCIRLENIDNITIL